MSRARLPYIAVMTLLLAAVGCSDDQRTPATGPVTPSEQDVSTSNTSNTFDPNLGRPLSGLMVRIALAGLHLLALGIGFGAVIDRAGALRSSPGPQSLRRAFTADSLWGIAALLWIGTGVWRVLAGSEKPTVYYAHSPLFM